MPYSVRPELDAAMRRLSAVTGMISKMEIGTLNVLKNFANPSYTIAKVLEAAAVLRGHNPKKWTWSKAKQELADASSFKLGIMTFEEDSVSSATIEKLEPYVSDPELELGKVEQVSSAAHVIMSWVLAIDAYFRAKHGRSQ